MREAYSLGLMLHGFAIDDGDAELVDDTFMNRITLEESVKSRVIKFMTYEVFNCAFVGP